MQSKQKDGAVAPWQACLDPVVADALAIAASRARRRDHAADRRGDPRVPPADEGGVRSRCSRRDRGDARASSSPSSGGPRPRAPDRDVYLGSAAASSASGRRPRCPAGRLSSGRAVAWRRVSEVARDQGADAATVSLLAESVFAYIDEISAESVEGYAQAQARRAPASGSVVAERSCVCSWRRRESSTSRHCEPGRATPAGNCRTGWRRSFARCPIRFA